MTSKSLRRLAKDHASLHTQGLPPNYIFHPSTATSDTFTTLSVLLAGPQASPYSNGLFHLDLSIPPTYPTNPPTAHFRTKVFHPNVDPSTGAVCVETLKRDWSPNLTLRDVLVTVYCLLLFPNPASALNEEAGVLVERDYKGFEKRAALWTGMYAAVSAGLEGEVQEARARGEEEIVPGEKGKKVRRVSGEKRKKIDEEGNGENVGSLAGQEFTALSARPGATVSNQSDQTPKQSALTSTQASSMDLDTPNDIHSHQHQASSQPPPPLLRSRRLRDRYTLNPSERASSPRTRMRDPSPRFDMPASQSQSQTVDTATSSFATAVSEPQSMDGISQSMTSFSTAVEGSTDLMTEPGPEHITKRPRLSSSPIPEPPRISSSISLNSNLDIDMNMNSSTSTNPMAPPSARVDSQTTDNAYPWLNWHLTSDPNTIPKKPARKPKDILPSRDFHGGMSSFRAGPRVGVFRL